MQRLISRQALKLGWDGFVWWERLRRPWMSTCVCGRLGGPSTHSSSPHREGSAVERSSPDGRAGRAVPPLGQKLTLVQQQFKAGPKCWKKGLHTNSPFAPASWTDPCCLAVARTRSKLSTRAFKSVEKSSTFIFSFPFLYKKVTNCCRQIIS